MRIDKFLAHNGFGSRNDVKKLLKEKVVSVNGEVVTKATFKIDIEHDIVSVSDEAIEYQEKVYYMMNKPAGYICSHVSNQYPSVIDLIDSYHDLIMVGRLDVDTEGLLLITNDGQFSHQIAHGKKDIFKKYYVELEEDFDASFIPDLEAGIMMDGEFLKEAKIEIIASNKIYVYIAEGKYHQVKRMMNYAHNEVAYLKRLSIGNLDLDETLDLGEYRDLTLEDFEKLLEVKEGQ